LRVLVTCIGTKFVLLTVRAHMPLEKSEYQYRDCS